MVKQLSSWQSPVVMVRWAQDLRAQLAVPREEHIPEFTGQRPHTTSGVAALAPDARLDLVHHLRKRKRFVHIVFSFHSGLAA